VRRAAGARWGGVLSRLQVQGGTSEQRRMLATALFHAHLMPHDLTGENVWWHSGTPHYEDYYGLWDTHRALHPLLLVLQPRRERDMINSLVETYEHTGWMPDTRIAGNNGLTQGGSNGDVLVADAIKKRLPGVRYRTAYRALRKNAEVDSRRLIYEGRQVSEYKRRGYISTDLPRSASRTVEYAHDDFGVYNVARLLGKTHAAARYRIRAGDWAHLWDRRRGRFGRAFPPASSYRASSAPTAIRTGSSRLGTRPSTRAAAGSTRPTFRTTSRG
jgi:putative alpha-1,2-mannosidase